MVVILLLAPDRIPKLATLLVVRGRKRGPGRGRGSPQCNRARPHWRGGASPGRHAARHDRPGLRRRRARASRNRSSRAPRDPTSLACGVSAPRPGRCLRARSPPRWLSRLSPGAPARLSHAWQDFKQPRAAALTTAAIGRFGTVSGNGRYDYWKAAVHATSGHLLDGSGPGTFVFLWQKRATYSSPVQNAHSLYFETLAEVGVVGLALLLGFFVLVIASAVRATVRAQDEERMRAAAITAALVAFALAAGVDWVWQIPALPAAFLCSARPCSCARRPRVVP